MIDKTDAAVATLEHLGYTHEGGNLWKPPLGKAPDFNLLDTLHARIASLEAQLSARQAAPDGWRLVPVEPDSNMKRAAQKALMDHSSHREWLEEEWPDGLRMWNGMLSAAPPPPEREPLSKQQVSKIALDLLMTNCTWHALQNTGFFHEIVPFSVELVAAAERAHGIGATND